MLFILLQRQIGCLLPLVAIAIIAFLISTKEIENSEDDVAATFESSAFPSELYHAVNEPLWSLPCFPKRIHISQASDLDIDEDTPTNRVDMTVSFSLDYPQCSGMSKPSVIYGSGLGSEGRASADPIQFNYTSPKTREYYESDLIYHVALKGLHGGSKRYWYRIEVESHTEIPIKKTARGLKGNSHFTDHSSNKIMSPVMSFSTPPLPGTPTTISFIGDLGQTEDSTVTMAHMFQGTFSSKEHPISLVMIAGDQSYADGEPSRWVHWLDIMEPLLRAVPVHVAAGNHEIECDKVSHMPFQFYENLFRNPNRLGPAEIEPISKEERRKLWIKGCTTPSEFLGHYNYGNSFCAVTHGLVRLITLSSYSDTSVGSAQYDWLKQELLSIDRAVTPWVIVVFHAPLYTTFLGHVNEIEAKRMRENFEPLFVVHKVNLIISGHDHAYMRTKPLAFGKVEEQGLAPVYLTIGAGGNREHHSHGYRHVRPEAWVAKRDRFEYGYGHLHVANRTHAEWRWVRDGNTLIGLPDNVWFMNPHSA